MVKQYIPEQGDIVYISFSPTLGHEQSGRRPALVISNSEFNGAGKLIFCCPITSKKKGYFFEVEVNTEKTKGVILCDHPRSLDAEIRKPRFIEKIDEETLRKVKGIVISIIE
jgi:mRNA interferase MazF